MSFQNAYTLFKTICVHFEEKVLLYSNFNLSQEKGT